MTPTDPYAGVRETTEGRVYTVTGGDWDDVAPTQRTSTPSGSSSTWARSIRRPTACCG